MAQMQTISIRIPDEDFQWLLAQQDAGAKTPSEKLRALLAKMRQQEAGLASHDACATWMRGLVQPLVDAVAALERREKTHSDVVGAVTEWVPQIMASLISARPDGQATPAQAAEVEAVLAQQCFRLLTGLLRASITSVPATYDKEVLDRYLPDIIEISEIISTRKGKELQNG